MRCQQAGVPAGIVQTGVDLAERDPQLALRDFLHEVREPHPLVERTWADRLPIRFQRTPCDEYRRAPVLGEHNAEVLAEWLGLTPAQVREGEEKGIYH